MSGSFLGGEEDSSSGLETASSSENDEDLLNMTSNFSSEAPPPEENSLLEDYVDIGYVEGEVYLLNQPLQCIFIAVILVLAVLANVLVIHNIEQNELKRRSVNFLLIKSLCIVDLVGAMLVLPWPLFVTAKGRWDLGETACRINSVINVALWFQHIVMFAMLKIDRVLASSLPIGKYPLLSTRTVTVIIIASWLLCFSVAGSVVAIFRSAYEPAVVLCIPELPIGFFITVFSVYVLTLLGMVTGYVFVICHLKKKQAQINGQNNMRVVDYKNLERAAQTSFLITLSHFLLYVPTMLVIGLHGWFLHPVAILLCDMVVYSEFLIHPVVLLITSTKLRQEIKATLKRAAMLAMPCVWSVVADVAWCCKSCALRRKKLNQQSRISDADTALAAAAAAKANKRREASLTDLNRHQKYIAESEPEASSPASPEPQTASPVQSCVIVEVKPQQNNSHLSTASLRRKGRSLSREERGINNKTGPLPQRYHQVQIEQTETNGTVVWHQQLCLQEEMMCVGGGGGPMMMPEEGKAQEKAQNGCDTKSRLEKGSSVIELRDVSSSLYNDQVQSSSSLQDGVTGNLSPAPATAAAATASLGSVGVSPTTSSDGAGDWTRDENQRRRRLTPRRPSASPHHLPEWRSPHEEKSRPPRRLLKKSFTFDVGSLPAAEVFLSEEANARRRNSCTTVTLQRVKKKENEAASGRNKTSALSNGSSSSDGVCSPSLSSCSSRNNGCRLSGQEQVETVLQPEMMFERSRQEEEHSSFSSRLCASEMDFIVGDEEQKKKEQELQEMEVLEGAKM